MSMPTRFAACLMATAVALPASANGAMGLGWEMFDVGAWLAYCAVVTLAEAILIGRWQQLPWYKAISLAIAANLLTGVACGLGGCGAPFFHYSMVGSRYDPSPFGHAIAVLTVTTILSGWLEGFIWRRFRAVEFTTLQVFKRCMLVHCLMIPLGLIILLIPAKPYPGFDAWGVSARTPAIRYLGDSIEAYAESHGRMPRATNPSDLAKEIQPYLENLSEGEAEIALYQASYGRFSFRDRRDKPLEINPLAAGMKLKGDIETWYMRSSDARYGLTIRIFEDTVGVQFSNGSSLFAQ